MTVMPCGNCGKYVKDNVAGTECEHCGWKVGQGITLTDPICGNCGKAKSEHAKELNRPELFCYMHTTGDIFTDEPRESVIFDKMQERYPTLYESLVEEWKRENGHV